MKFLNQKGMTLIEVLIGAALMGGIALVAAKLMGDQANNQAYLKNAAALSGLVSKIEGLINNPANCKAMFVGKLVSDSPGVPMGISGTLDPVVMTLINPMGNPVNVLGEGTYGSYSIPDNGIKLQRSVYGAAITDLVITFKSNSNSFISRHRNEVVRRIPFVTQDNAGIISDCGPVLRDAEQV
ncbi:MAG: type II secretion system protein, partial [Bdellovibrionales bacterium]|nr:type II secretion system protein [Bdellovibrionales bacterium]